MFLTENDYIVTSADALTIFQQSTPEKREQAEKMAVEEIDRKSTRLNSSHP